MFFPTSLQSLPPFAAHLCLDVERFLCEQLGSPRGMSFLLSLSGGADSTAMLCIMNLLQKRLGFSLSAVTFDHALRMEAHADADFVRWFCHRLGIDCSIHEIDVSGFSHTHQCGLEETGRILRYSILENERKSCGANYIAIGHHVDDLGEDVFLRLSRGSGWPSLAGMKARDENRHIIRPLLLLNPGRLQDFLSACHIPWRCDASNSDLRFKRNRIRHKVMPLFKEENPSFNHAIEQLWRFARLDEDFLNSQIDKILAEFPCQEQSCNGKHCVLLSRQLLSLCHPAMRLRLYRRALQQISSKGKGNALTVRSDLLFDIENALKTNGGTRRFKASKNLEIAVVRGQVELTLTFPDSN